MFGPWDDPYVKVQREKLKKFIRRHGRYPKNQEEFEQDQCDKLRSSALKEQEKLNRERREYVERSRKEQERSAIISDRELRVANPPEGYTPPTSIEELIQRIDSGEVYFQYSHLVAIEKEKLTLKLDLEGMDFSHSKLENCQFSKGCTLAKAQLRDCKIVKCEFSAGCDLSGTVFRESDFRNVRLEEDVDCQDAIFTGSKFRQCRFDSLTIEGACFDGCEFFETKPPEFDRNYIRGANFHSGGSNLWQKLSSSYAGIWQFVNLMWAIVYFSPIVLKIMLLDLISSLQGKDIYTHIESAIIAHTGVERYGVPGKNFILGFDPTSVIVFLTFMAYQSARLLVTMRVGPMIEDEKRVGYTPRRQNYGPLWKLHVWVRGFAMIAVITYIYYVLRVFVGQIFLYK